MSSPKRSVPKGVSKPLRPRAKRMIARDRLWWHLCMPYGVWVSGQRTVLFNRYYLPVVIYDPRHKPPIYVPASAWMFKQAYENWDQWDWIGPPPPASEWVKWSRQALFYTDRDPPWLEGKASGETCVRLMLILDDFMHGKMPDLSTASRVH